MTNMVILLSEKCRLILFIKMNVMVSTSCWVTSHSIEQLGTVYWASIVWRGRAGFTRVKRAGKRKDWITGVKKDCWELADLAIDRGGDSREFCRKRSLPLSDPGLWDDWSGRDCRRFSFSHPGSCRENLKATGAAVTTEGLHRVLAWLQAKDRVFWWLERWSFVEVKSSHSYF